MQKMLNSRSSALYKSYSEETYLAHK